MSVQPTATAVAVLAALLATAAPAAAQTEVQVVESEGRGAERIEQTYVRVHAPLPEAAGPRPEACDWIGYLRFRARQGPERPGAADAIGVFMPGYLGGAAYFDQVARNTVLSALRRGRFVEFWALDRRSNCLEDHTGIRAAAQARDPSLAYGYYWGGQAVDGRTFPGFAAGEQTAFLRAVGLEQTVRDWHTVLTTAIPDARERRRKVVCGGHSLGGPITAAFASWDFDGDPATSGDAGFNQCAGYAGFDTRIALTPRATGLSLSPTGVLNLAGSVQDSPNENTPPLTPETFQLPAVFGVGAYFDPDGTDLLRELPSTLNIDVAQRLLFSRDATAFAIGPTIRDFTLTNELVLAGIFDDNSAPLSFLRASVGFITGGPVADKDFPTPGDGSLAIPAEPSTPVYGWANYDEVGDDVPLNGDGAPFTSIESEVSDVRQLARTMFEAPVNFIEQYFPRALRDDVAAAGNGSREGGLANLVHEGPAKRSILLIQAGESDDTLEPDEGEPEVGEPANDRPLSRRVTIPGYNHNDVLTAAARQNDGRPEPSSTELARYLLTIAGPPRIRFARVRRAGDRVRVRLARVAGCTRGVTIRSGRHRARTDARGRASLRAGRRIVASKRGCVDGRTKLRRSGS